MSNGPVSPDELLECLERSGYLLESRIVRELDTRGYFVEPSQVLQDPRTGKSRDIDFIAEYYSLLQGAREPRRQNHFRRRGRQQPLSGRLANTAAFFAQL
jgi:hypothetical protein